MKRRLPPPKTFCFSLILCALALLGCFGLVGCTDEDRDSNGPAVVLKSIALEPASFQLAIGDQITLNATGTYSDGTTKDISGLVTWESDDDAIASVEDGEVTGVAEGDTAIIASYQNLSAQAAVQVTTEGPELVSLRVKSEEETVKLPGTVQLEAEAVYSDGSARQVPDELAIKWTSSDENVATVDGNGLVTGVKVGNAIIAVQSADGQYTCSRDCKVLVESDVVLDAITLEPKSLQLKIGENATLSATGTYSDGTTEDISKFVTWESADTTKASVEDGVVTGVAAGDTTVTASYQGKSDTAEVKVTRSLEAITLEPDPLQLEEGTTATLSAKGSYSDGTTEDISKLVTWESADTTKASVEDGVVTGVAAGDTTVTASYQDKSATATVKITPVLVSLRVKSEAETVKVLIGNVTLEAEAVYSDGSAGQVPDDIELKWISGGPAVATVDDEGVVTGRRCGDADITVLSADFKYMCSRPCKVSVVEPEVDDVATFGKWYDKNGALDESITWTVMRVEEQTAEHQKRALLVADKALDTQLYYSTKDEITWKYCSLRQWLTGSDEMGTDSVFYNTAFNSTEKLSIDLTKHETCGWGGTGTYGEETQDRVFLLDEAEVKDLYPVEADRTCPCTEYTKQKKAYVDFGCCYWWLRSPGKQLNYAGRINCYGKVDNIDVNAPRYSVRPALYIVF